MKEQEIVGRIINNQRFEDFRAEFISESWMNPKSAQRQANRYAAAIKAALDILDKAPAGTRLYFAGSCPSGGTYESAPGWDGTVESKRKILLAALDHAVGMAWDGHLVTDENSRSGRFAAEMRM
jgi:hypothetical protein